MKAKRYGFILMLSLVLVFLVGCNGKEGKSMLSLTVENNAIIMENDNVRVVLNEENGSIQEYLNKEENLYLVKGVTDSTAIRLSGEVETSSGSIAEKTLDANEFEYSVNEGEDILEVNQIFRFSNGVSAICKISLKKNADEVVFRVVELSGMKENTPTYSLEYPIFDGIDTLDTYETDRFVSPFAMGYLFYNPIETFANGDKSIGKGLGYYPSGMFQSMQFFAYYSEDKGGFYVQAKDEEGTVKSFTFTESDKKLRASIWHYVADIGESSCSFDYDVICANLVEGNWYEPAEKYREWAHEQKWCTKYGKNEQRYDLNLELYEDTVLCNFIEPSKTSQAGCTDIYNEIRANVEGKILVIPYYWTLKPTPTYTDNISLVSHKENVSDIKFFKAVEENEDIVAYFEYFNCALDSLMPEGLESNVLLDKNGNVQECVFGSTRFLVQCPASSEWNELVYNRELIIGEQLGADGFYNDIGIGATISTLCYDTNHDHGTKVSVLAESLDQLKNVYDISRQFNGFTGQEMISEVMIPYVDSYQCRANAGEMGGMESDVIMDYVKAGTAEKIHLFEYVYSEYCGVRLDAFTLPLSSVGTPYYYVTAFTALNGGIPEFNWEWTGDLTYPTAEKYDTDMIQFVSTLGEARRSYGKEYLVYGKMVRTPDVGAEKIRYDYSTPINNGDGSWSNFDEQGNKVGEMLCDNIVVSAYEHNGSIAIFLCNVTDEEMSTTFTLDTDALYGMLEGNIQCYTNGVSETLCSLQKGKAEISINLPSREVVMLVISE